MSRKLTTTEFIQDSVAIHGNVYDYSKVNYINMKTKVNIICKEHGVFSMRPKDHIHLKQRCPKCYGTFKYDNDEFIYKSKKIHGNAYDYSKVNYVDSKTKVDLICPKHGEFKTIPNDHLSQGCGCPKCSGRMLSTTAEFIQDSVLIHGNVYDYSKVNYINAKTKVDIICSKHGEFKIMPDMHINQKQGCPRCKSSKGEKEISKLLEESNIIFTQQKTFNGCKNKRPLPFDFYLDDYNIAIEFDGIQHFKPVEFFGGEEAFKYVQQNDLIKTQYCKENKVILYRIKYDDNIEQKISQLVSKKINVITNI